MSDSPADSGDSMATPAEVRLEESRVAQRRLLKILKGYAVDVSQLVWLPVDEAESEIHHWTADIGAQRYGALFINPPAGVNFRRGEFRNGNLPDWIRRTPARVIIQFFRPYSGHLLARCDFLFALDNIVPLARADGDGFAVMTPDLDAVMRVNVEERLGDSALDIDAWGDFIYDPGKQE